MVSGFLELVFVGLLELPSVAVVVAESVLLKVLRPDLCPGGGGVDLVILSAIDGGATILSSADDSVFSSHDLASRLLNEIRMVRNCLSLLRLRMAVETFWRTYIGHLVVLGDTVRSVAASACLLHAGR